MRRLPGLLVLLLAARPAPARAQSASYEYLQSFSSVVSHIRLNYVDSVGYRELVRAAIDGALRSLDPHSYFVSREDWLRQSALDRGELATTGLNLDDADSAVVVLSVLRGSPASRAGILPGDRVTAVQDTTTRGLRARDVALRLAGEKGSRVRVRLARGNPLEPDSFAVELKREALVKRSVGTTAMVAPGVGYVALEEFGPRAADELQDAIDALRGKKATAILLDLRGNPGGIVVQAVDVASLFLPEGTLVFSTRGRRKDVAKRYDTKKDGRFAGLPIAVLVDERSASAAEALAASLQDHDRAALVGRRTFGKALMQSLFVVSPTEDNVWLTVGWVESPSGRVIQRKYTGLGYYQYRAAAGRGGAEPDTATVYRTGRGRPVRGGGGVAPDITVPAPAEIPVWVTVAADSGAFVAIADSVAATLPATPAGLDAWRGAPERWDRELAEPFLTRARALTGVRGALEPDARARVARSLASRVVEVRWGTEAGDQFRLATDPDVAIALRQLTTDPLGPGQGK